VREGVRRPPRGAEPAANLLNANQNPLNCSNPNPPNLLNLLNPLNRLNPLNLLTLLKKEEPATGKMTGFCRTAGEPEKPEMRSGI
jgi:hypothetical protein